MGILMVEKKEDICVSQRKEMMVCGGLVDGMKFLYSFNKKR